MKRAENKKSQTKCICGEYEVQVVDHVGPTFPNMGEFAKQGVSVGRCQKCGVMRQLAPTISTEEDYVNYYRDEYPPTSDSYVAKDYKHDLELAKKRCADYQIIKGSRDKILDVGSGSGAFVEHCRNLGTEAYGCEISKYAYARPSEDPFIYRERLENIHFPTDHFDKVACHDVIEHVLDPIQFIEELFRILKQQGTCFIDFPRFFHTAGRHHWKPEHIWYFSVDDLKRILEQVGFSIDDIQIKYPIESKVVFHVTKPAQVRPTILVPPGLGDSLWSLVKLQSFLKREGLGLPDVHIVCPKDRKFDGHKRSIPFLQMFPFLHCTGKVYEGSGPNKELKKIWNEAYGQKGRTIFKDIYEGVDYFIAYNGWMRFGKSLEEVDPDLECNWDLPMWVSLEQKRFQKECEARFGPYIIFYFVFQGTYRNWTAQFPIEQVIKFVRHTVERTGLHPVFAGAIWDQHQDRLLQRVINGVPGATNMAGKTNLQQLFGMIKGSEVVVGYPSGLTIMSAVFKHPTMMIWNKFYDNDFAWHACPPETKNKTYFIEDTKQYDIDRWVDKVEKIALIKEAGKSKPAESVELVEKSLPKISVPVQTVPKAKARDFKIKERVTALCVLRSGGDFTIDWVNRLSNMLRRNVTVSYQFVCLTDTPIKLSDGKCIELKHDFPKWWSKVELFRKGLVNSEHLIYFDLDTVITGNIDPLFEMNFDFSALQPWNPTNRKNGYFASGLMAWKNGDYSFLYDEFNIGSIDNWPVGDQEYMSKALQKRKKKFTPLQKTVSGIYSFKRNCRGGLPADARIVCFHGKPRPDEMSAPWVKEHWR